MQGNPQQKEYKEKRVIYSGCSRHMTGNKCYLTENEDYDGGFVSFRDGKGLTYLFAKATIDESKLWHRRLGHTNFKNLNKLVRGNLVRGLPSKMFKNDHSCVACQKGKQHKASYKAKLGIKREFSIARTPQQNGVAKRRNRTLIEALRTNRTLIEAARTMKRDNTVARQAEKKIEPAQEYILIHICTTDPLISQYPKVSKEDAEEKSTKMDKSGASNKDREDDQATRSEFERLLQQEKHTVHTNSINTASTPVSTTRPSCTDDDLSSLVNAAEASNAFEEHLFE
ncbi:ribonuclease H-like domain-containing protein [Tanacetum coccineum]